MVFNLIRRNASMTDERSFQGGFFVAKRKTTIPFHGTAEQEKKLKQIIDEHKNMEGALMPVLQQAQEVYGYLPIEVQEMIADGLNLPLEQVYGVTTFYSWFSLEPKGQHVIRVCLGTACYVKGSQNVLSELERCLGIEAGHTSPDGKFSLEATRCLGCCGLAPVMTIDDEVYGRMTTAMVADILKKYQD
jgi:NADP-reducing hydrogenase subunit HndA